MTKCKYLVYYTLIEHISLQQLVIYINCIHVYLQSIIILWKSKNNKTLQSRWWYQRFIFIMKRNLAVGYNLYLSLYEMHQWRRTVVEWLRCLPLNSWVAVSLSPTFGHNHDSSHDTSTGYYEYKEVDLTVLNISCDIFFYNQA